MDHEDGVLVLPKKKEFGGLGVLKYLAAVAPVGQGDLSIQLQGADQSIGCPAMDGQKPSNASVFAHRAST